jgi:hypothetical protein
MTYKEEWEKYYTKSKPQFPKKDFLERRKLLTHIKEGELDEMVADIIFMRYKAEINKFTTGSHPLAILARTDRRSSMSNRTWAKPKKCY